MLEVRDAGPGDHIRIVNWNEALARETEDRLLDVTLIARGVERVLSDGTLGRYFIAESDGSPAGQLGLTWEWSDWRNGLFWWIQSVYVAPRYRGIGVFRALYRHVEALGRADPQVCGLRLYVHDDNKSAIETYRRLGMDDCHYRVMETSFR